MNRKEKFLIVASFAATIIKFRGNLMKKLSEKYDVFIACPKPDIEIVNFLKLNQIKHIELEVQNSKISIISDIFYFLKLARIVLNLKPKKLLSYTIKPVFYSGFLRLLLKFDFYPMITGLGSFFETNNNKFFKKIFIILLRISLKGAQKIIFYNEGNRSIFLKYKICHIDKTEIIPGSGVDIKFYKTRPKTTNSSNINFLCIARLLKDKGLKEYLEAAREIKSKYKNTRFTLLGWFQDSDQSLSINYVNQFIEDGSIIFHDFEKDVRPIIQQCDIFVLPSYHEGMPRSALEAMSMSKPVLLSEIPGTLGLVESGKNGYYFKIKSKESLVQAMKKILENETALKSFGKRSRQIVEDNYSDEIINNRLIGIFN